MQPHMEAICRFMLQSTADIHNPEVALEACEFWLTFASLEDDVCTPDMVAQVATVLAQLVPLLLRGMVYLPEQQEELLVRNELALQDNVMDHSVKPVFHKSKTKRGSDDDDEDDDDDFDDDEGNSWTLRKCSAASLDCLAGMYGPDGILPPLLPALQEGLANNDVWVQEASILALGAIADGCKDAMATHMGELHPFLMTHLAAPEGPNTLPQIKSIAAWTIGRYSSWAVEQVQTGVQGHLLAHMTEVFLTRLNDKNPKVQVSCCSAFGVLIEHAGELMVPYLEPLFQGLVAALTRYQGRSLLIVLDVIGITSDFAGSAIGEGNLPEMYIPRLLSMWDDLAKVDPSNRTIVPLLESLASIALVCGANFQPYALQAFDGAMCMIESVTLQLTTTGDRIEHDEDADPIVCAADLIDGLAEGLGANFVTLVASSTRYGPMFLNVVVSLTQHEIPGVRMSAFAIIGDVARNAPAVLEPALPQILRESINNLNPIQPSVCNNAVWAIGEVCVKCQGNPAPLEGVAPDLVQRLVALLSGNGPNGGVVGIVGLPENAATTTGRLALVKPAFVSSDLPRFLLGWCDAMAKIADPTERRDAFQGFVQAIYANPEAIQRATVNASDSIASILFAVVSWHMPQDFDPAAIYQVQFEPFPQEQSDVETSLRKLLHDIKKSVGNDTWSAVEKGIPVNVRQFLREAYQV